MGGHADFVLLCLWQNPLRLSFFLSLETLLCIYNCMFQYKFVGILGLHVCTNVLVIGNNIMFYGKSTCLIQSSTGKGITFFKNYLLI